MPNYIIAIFIPRTRAFVTRTNEQSVLFKLLKKAVLN